MDRGYTISLKQNISGKIRKMRLIAKIIESDFEVEEEINLLSSVELAVNKDHNSFPIRCWITEIDQ